MTTGAAIARAGLATPGFTLRVPARNPSIRSALAEVRARLALHELGSESLDTVEVVLAEVMNNVAEHAFAWRQDGEMLLYLKMTSDGLTCSITDEGRAMPDDTLSTAPQPVSEAAGDGPSEGGYGWLIIRQLARDVAYVRKDGVNQLTFRLMVGPPHDSRAGLG